MRDIRMQLGIPTGRMGQIHVKKQCHPFMVIVPTMATGVLGGNIIGVEQPIGLA